jgi:hypothetical protein
MISGTITAKERSFTMKNSKGFLAGFISSALLIAAIGTASAAYTKAETLNFNGIKLMVNGEYVEITDSTGAATEPFIINGTTYLPVGNVAKIVGYDVKWDGETQTVILEQPEAQAGSLEQSEAQKTTYITRTGKKWHNNPNCNGGTYWAVPYDTAVGLGLTPCEKCVLD